MSHVFGRDDRISDTESVGLEFPDEEDYQIEYAGRLVCLFAPAVPVCAMALRMHTFEKTLGLHATMLSSAASGSHVQQIHCRESSDPTASDEDVASWVSWFCSLKGNEFFCEVEEDFISDDFNLSGLSSQVPYYDYALDLILDSDSSTTEILTEEQHELVESAAEMLYGLIHVRFILTSRGMSAMFEKFKTCEFGRCPRVLCNGQPCLPVGIADVPRQSTVKLFCPKCKDIYYPRSKYQGNVDGAYFGTTFPHLLLMTYPSLRPSQPTENYTPRVFGFKLHPSSEAAAAAALEAAAANRQNAADQSRAAAAAAGAAAAEATRAVMQASGPSAQH